MRFSETIPTAAFVLNMRTRGNYGRGALYTLKYTFLLLYRNNRSYEDQSIIYETVDFVSFITVNRNDRRSKRRVPLLMINI